jgi:hypothetical protein
MSTARPLSGPPEWYTVNRLAPGDLDRPDVAIEVVWTSGGFDKLDIPQLPRDLLLACWRGPDQTSALHALRAGLRET